MMASSNITSMSNADVGKAFNAIVKGVGRNDIGEILFNWNESQLNMDGDKIIGYPGRDGVFSRGKEGGKVNISKRALLEWIFSDNPFDEKVYGVNIRNDPEWTGLICRARNVTLIKTPPHLPSNATNKFLSCLCESNNGWQRTL